jgi:hypothetical protein
MGLQTTGNGKIKIDKKPPKSKIMALLSKSNFAYGMGAAVVIVGALLAF